jgi:hypothetical protein
MLPANGPLPGRRPGQGRATLRTLALSALALGALTTAVVGAAGAQTQITGCLDRNNGDLYNVTTGAAPSAACKSGDTTLSWNIQGPPGPEGPQGPAGQDGADGAPGAGGAGAVQFEWVANSFADFSPGTGLVRLNRACHNTLPGSRMCTSEEVLRSRTNFEPPQQLGDSLWVAPTIIGFTPTGEALDILGASGDYRDELTCGGWTFSGSTFTGLTIDQQFGFPLLKSCNSFFAVACCAPVDVVPIDAGGP